MTNELFVLHGVRIKRNGGGPLHFINNYFLLEGLQWMEVFTVYGLKYLNSTNHLVQKFNSFYELGL